LIDPMDGNSVYATLEHLNKEAFGEKSGDFHTHIYDFQRKSIIEGKAVDITTLGYKFDQLIDLFEISLPEENQTSHKLLNKISEPSNMPPKCIFMPSKSLIHKMIRAIMKFKDVHPDELLKKFAF